MKNEAQCDYHKDAPDPAKRCPRKATRKWGDHWFCDEHGNRDGHSALKVAQSCFVEWLNDLDAVLIDSQREHENAILALKARDTKAFANALGRMAGHVDQARNAIAEGLDAGV